MEAGTGIYYLESSQKVAFTDEFTYMLCNDACPDNCSIATVSLRVNSSLDDLEDGTIHVITPDDDGFNDGFHTGIENLAMEFPGNELIIFNRWGDKIFETSPYDNDWKGTNQQGGTLPEGTYYYLLRLRDNASTEIYGSVTVIR